MTELKFDRREFNWTDEPVVGMALSMKGAEIDSHGKPIDGNIFYEVGKHRKTGQVLIIPTDKNQLNEFMNDQMKRSGKLN